MTAIDAPLAGYGARHLRRGGGGRGGRPPPGPPPGRSYPTGWPPVMSIDEPLT